MAHMGEYFMISTGINPKVKTAQKSRNHLALCKIFWLENTTQTSSTYTSFKRRHYHISTIIKNATIQECFFWNVKLSIKYVFKMHLFIRTFYNLLRQQNDFEWTIEHERGSMKLRS